MSKLTALQVKRESRAGRYGDGGGLWLQVRDAEHKSWLFRYTMAGRAREMGLGPTDIVPLSEARAAALAARKTVFQGIDPIDAKREAAAAAKLAVADTTFRRVAEMYIEAHEGTWKNAKHTAQWRATLEAHAFPAFGDKPTARVETGDIMSVLEPIWRKTPETASRLRGRIEAVMDYAKARGWRVGENPARWRGHVQNLLPARSKVAKVEHHAALPWSEIGAFMGALRAQAGTSARAVEFAILTAARTGEAWGATWEEMDIEAKLWRIPGIRMKAGVDHAVPLSAPALAVLEAMKPAKELPGAFVFPGQKEGKPLSNMAGQMLLRRMERSDVTVHGFRSTFRDWAADSTSYPREVAEAALAHTLRDKVEAAYRRSDLLAKRVQLMDEWGVVCAQSKKPVEPAA
jgi:integrase